MADRLRSFRAALPTLLCAVCLGALSAPGWAQTPMLADPTRPPAGVIDAAETGEASAGRVLQFVIIPRQGKPLAVIDGQTVRLGQRYGDARLVKVSEREAVLDGPQGRERLLLTPGVEKTDIRPAKVTKRPAGRNER